MTIKVAAGLLGVIAAAAVAGLQAAEPRALPAQAGAAAPDPSRTFLDTNCIVCHNSTRLTANLALDAAALDPREAPRRADVWEKVIRKLRTGAMPPAGRPRPEPGALTDFVSHLETTIDAAAGRRPQVGRPVAHRLNRTEYANAIRDLLGLEVDAEELLPPDDAGYGFDNIGDVLTVSPMLLERYMSAAGKVARLATGSARDASTHVYSLSKYLRQHDRMGEDLPFGTRGGTAVRHTFPVTGDYIVKLRLLKNHRDQIRGMASATSSRSGSTVNDCRSSPSDGPAPKIRQRRSRWTGRSTSCMPTRDSTCVCGRRRGHIWCRPRSWRNRPCRKGRCSRRCRSRATGSALTWRSMRRKNLPCGPCTSRGRSTRGPRRSPVSETPRAGGASSSASRRQPARNAPCAREIFSRLARRAFRRPITDTDLDTLLAFFDEGRTRGGFEAGVEFALRKVLVSPEFLFRIERDPPHAPRGAPIG